MLQLVDLVRDAEKKHPINEAYDDHPNVGQSIC